ncbi:hypothetical protein AMATHDRAFT_88981, partial [Amanita thiersii Skay4041]
MSKIKPLRPPVFLGAEVETQTPADVSESTSNIIAFGVELIVAGLDRSSPTAAISHVKKLLEEINLSNPKDRLPDLVITSPDKTHAIDYVALSLPSTLTTEPRPDLLIDVWQALQKYDFLSIDWRPSSGADRRRRIWYQAPVDSTLSNLKQTIDSFLDTRGIEHLPGFYMRNLNRVTYDIIRFQDVSDLLNTPIPFSNKLIFPLQSRLIRPYYGVECCLVGVQSIQNIKSHIDAYIHQTYGTNAIAHSQLALDDDVYCVVFNKPEIAMRFLNDPFSAFSNLPNINHFIRVSPPMFIYNYNNMGCPTNSFLNKTLQPALSSDPSMDLLNEKINNISTNCDRAIAHQTHKIEGNSALIRG